MGDFANAAVPSHFCASSGSRRCLHGWSTAVERVNSRIDQVYGFERHFIRGHKKMRLRMGLAIPIADTSLSVRYAIHCKSQKAWGVM
jgi:hypothetical protein